MQNTLYEINIEKFGYRSRGFTLLRKLYKLLLHSSLEISEKAKHTCVLNSTDQDPRAQDNANAKFRVVHLITAVV